MYGTVYRKMDDKFVIRDENYRLVAVFSPFGRLLKVTVTYSYTGLSAKLLLHILKWMMNS